MKVLVIDDDPMIVEMLRLVLDLEPGWSFEPYELPEEGVQAAIATHPDVILLDLSFPHADGRDVLRTLRADPRTRDIPVMFCSGTIGPDTRRELLELGADGLIEKPYNLMELAGQVRNALRSRM